jgi:hypothetical protein
MRKDMQFNRFMHLVELLAEINFKSRIKFLLAFLSTKEHAFKEAGYKR